MSHKGQKAYYYPLKLKITATDYAEINDNRAAETKFGVDEKGIGKWRVNKEERISTVGKLEGVQQRAVFGSGWRPFKEKPEETVLG